MTESVSPVPDTPKLDAEPSTPSCDLALESDSPMVISNGELRTGRGCSIVYFAAEEEYDKDWCNEISFGKRVSCLLLALVDYC
jgi:hypothetical protein